MAIVKFNSEEGFSVGYNPIDVIDANGNVIANVLNVTTSAALGSIGSITILGGSNGQAIVTDGLGNLSFETIAGGGGTPQGPFGALQYNNFGNLGGDANLYYNPTLNILYAPVYSGDGALLSNIPGPNVVGVVPNANFASYSDLATFSTLAFYVSEANQPNITSVGTLTSLSVSGNTDANTINAGNVSAANYFIGNGAYINYIDGNAVVGTVANANYAVFALNTIDANAANSALNVIGSSQPNITAVGSLGNLVVIGNANVDFVEANGMISNSSLLVKGDTTMLGNLIVYGNTIYADVTSLIVKDPIIEMGGNPNGSPLIANDGFDRGTLMHYFTTLPVDAFMGWDSSNAEFTMASNVSLVNNNITIHSLGNLRANYFIGNGAGLSNIVAANVDGSVANAGFSDNANNAYYAGNITINAQPNITSLGVLSNVSVSGNVDSGNANLGNLVYGNFFIGDGSNLANINAGNVIGTVSNAAYAPTTDTANTAGTVTTAAQPNITSVGTLTSLTVSGNVDSLNANLGDIVTANYYVGNGFNLSDVAGANVSGIVANANYAAYSDYVLTAAQPNITSVGVLTSISTTGNIDAANANLGTIAIANYFAGNGYNLFGMLGANLIGEVANSNYSTFSGDAVNAVNATNATTAGTITTNAQPNITSVGTLISLSVTGNITSGNASLGNTATANYFVGNGNALGNIYGPNVSGIVANANFAAYSEQANTANAAVVAGTVITASQPNITSVGTITSLSVTGNANIGNLNSSANGSFVGNVTANTFVGNFSGVILSNVAAPGNNYELIFNNLGNTGASNSFTFNNSTNVATLNGNLIVSTDITRDSKTVVTYVVQSGAPANAKPGDGWYDTDNDRTYTYTYDGVSYQWVDVTSGYLNANTAAVGNTLVLRDINGNITANSLHANLLIGNGYQISGLTISNSLQDVVISSPTNGEFLKYNGLNWVNASGGAVSAGAGVDFFVTGPVVIAKTANNFFQIDSLSTEPNATQTFANATINNTTAVVFGARYLGGLGRTSIDAGTWDFTLYANVDSTGGTSQIAPGLNIVEAPNVTVTTTGTGTQRTATTSGNAFANITASGNILLCSFLRTPQGLYQISAKTSNTVVTIETPSAYVNETNATNVGVGNPFVRAPFQTITSTSISRHDFSVIETARTVSTTDTLGFLVFGSTTNNKTITVTVGGTTNAIHISTPLATLHDSLAGLQGGTLNEFYHLTYNEYVGTGTGPFVREANANLTTPNIGNAFGTSLSITGNITAADGNLGNLLIANFFSGNGNYLVNIPGGNVFGTVANANFAAYAGNITLNAQSNITSVGVLSSLSVSGNLHSGNANLGNLAIANHFQGNAANLFGIPGANVTGTVANATHASTANTVVDAAQSNITSVGILSSLSVSGNIDVANANLGNLATANYFSGNAANLFGIPGSNVTGTVANANYAAYAGDVVNSTQSNITTVGTLTNLSVSGNISASGNVSFTGNITGNVISGNIVGSKEFKSLRSNIAVTTSTVVDEFAVSTYRTAKYIVQAQGDIGYQSVEVLLVHNNTDSFITIFASVYSNAEVITISSNVVTGNTKLYATAAGANTTVNLLSMYIVD
jgi:hypothetical protein